MYSPAAMLNTPASPVAMPATITAIALTGRAGDRRDDRERRYEPILGAEHDLADLAQ